MKKRLIIMTLVGTMVLAPMNIFADEKDDRIAELESQVVELQAQLDALKEKYEPSSQEETVSDFSYTYEGHTFKYLRNTVENVTEGKMLYVFFEYTNNTGETCLPAYSLNVTAFQHGIQLDSYMAGYEDPHKEAEILYKELKNGTTADVAFKFLIDDMSDIDIEISPIMYWGEVEIGEYTFSITE